MVTEVRWVGRMSIFNILAAHNPDSQPKQLTGAYFPDESATSRELRVAGGEVDPALVSIISSW